MNEAMLSRIGDLLIGVGRLLKSDDVGIPSEVGIVNECVQRIESELNSSKENPNQEGT